MVYNIVPFIISSCLIIMLFFLLNFNIGIFVAIIVGCVLAYYITFNTTQELFQDNACNYIDMQSELAGFNTFAKKISKYNPILCAALTEKLATFYNLYNATTAENFSTNIVELEQLKRNIQNDYYQFIFSVPSDQKYTTTINHGEIILSNMLSNQINSLIKVHMPTYDTRSEKVLPFSEYKDIFNPISFEIV